MRLGLTADHGALSVTTYLLLVSVFFLRPGFFFFFFGTFKETVMEIICVFNDLFASLNISGGTDNITDVPGVRSCVLGFHGALHFPSGTTVNGSAP